MDSGKIYSEQDVWEIIDYNSMLVDAVVCTGGEPTLQETALSFILKTAKDYDLRTMVDTNGSRPDVIRKLSDRIDRVALDMKTILMPTSYMDLCSVDRWTYIKVRDTLKIVKNLGMELEVRTTVVPGTWAGPENIEYIAKIIQPYTDEYHLQQFIPTDALDKTLTKTLSFDQLYELGMQVKALGIPKVLIKSKERTEYVTED